MKTRQSNPNLRRSMTLIELLIVIAILLAIGGLVLVNVMPRREQATRDIQRVQLQMIEQALKQFRLDLERWPTEDEGLESLWQRDALEEEDDQQRWRGPYVENPVSKDRWDNDLIYRYPGEIRGESFYDLISLGPDGEEGSEDDISNHDHLRDAEGEIAEEFTDFGNDPAQGP